MGLKIIGAGIGRTGTESLKLALEKLGFGKCYHMSELVRNPDHIVYWEALEEGKEVDLGALFKGYQSAVDIPTYLYYEKLMDAFPDAKVILTVRDPESWYRSASRTIFRPIPKFFFLMASVVGIFSKRARMFPRIFRFVKRTGLDGLFGGRTSDAAYCQSVFQDWIKRVEETVPPDKLLVYKAGQGWEPLCRFMGVPVPDEPFPHSNRAGSFQKNQRKQVLSARKD